jgi:hypothetical protein
MVLKNNTKNAEIHSSFSLSPDAASCTLLVPTNDVHVEQAKLE